jgi:hypothetical protein
MENIDGRRTDYAGLFTLEQPGAVETPRMLTLPEDPEQKRIDSQASCGHDG